MKIKIEYLRHNDEKNQDPPDRKFTVMNSVVNKIERAENSIDKIQLIRQQQKPFTFLQSAIISETCKMFTILHL